MPLNCSRHGGADTKQQNSSHTIYLNEQQLITLLNFVIDNVYITFGNKVIRQKFGIPIGISPGAQLANIYLFAHELRWIKNMVARAEELDLLRIESNSIIDSQSSTSSKVSYADLWKLIHRFRGNKRFIDDMIDCSNGLLSKWKYNNTSHHNVNGIFNPTDMQCNEEQVSITSIHFTDCTATQIIDKSKRPIIQLSVYDKREHHPLNKIDHIQYPAWNSLISQQTKTNIIHNELRRYSNISTNRQPFVQRCHILFRKLHTRGYPFLCIYQHMSKFFYHNPSLYCYAPTKGLILDASAAFPITPSQSSPWELHRKHVQHLINSRKRSKSTRESRRKRLKFLKSTTS